MGYVLQPLHTAAEEWRDTMKQIDIKKLKFDKNGLIPAVVQDFESGEVLALVYMTEEAVQKTMTSGYTHCYCGDAKKVVKYGEGKGNSQKVMAVFVANNLGSLLVKAAQKGCADEIEKSFTCYANQILGEYNTIGGEMFGRLQRIIADVKKNPEDGAYTSFLFVRGIDRIGKKVGEEAVELVIASKNQEKTSVVNEAADLLYHVMVLLSAKGVKLSEVCAELCKRNR